LNGAGAIILALKIPENGKAGRKLNIYYKNSTSPMQ
jgi:hypothetical protein